MQATVERRRKKRFLAADRTFVFFKSKPAMSGRILDVSSAGMAFKCLASKRRTDESLSLNTLCIEHGLRLEAIPAKTISDFKLRGEGPDGTRRCGVEFGRLTEEQKQKVKRFIDTCTTCEA